MNGTITLISDIISRDLLRITVNVSNIENSILGAAFNMNFDSGSLSYLRHEGGNFLEKSGGEPFYLVQPKRDDQSGLIFGATLKNGDQLVSGQGELVYFYFQVLEKSKVTFSFENGVIATVSNGLRRNLEDIVWENLDLDLQQTEHRADVVDKDYNGAISYDSSPWAANVMSDFVSDNYSVLAVLLFLLICLLVLLRLRKL